MIIMGFLLTTALPNFIRMEILMDENRFRTNLKELPQHLNMNTISAGLVAAIFGCTGPALIIIGAATTGGLTYTQAISWIFAVYFFSGLLGIFIALKYRQPISVAHTIAGAVLMAGSLTHFSIHEAIGAYIIANILVILLGSTGLIEKVMKWIPLPIVMGMITGLMIQFATDMITSITIKPLLAGLAILTFLLSSRYLKKFPPVLSALLVSVVVAIFTNAFEFPAVQNVFVLPEVVIGGGLTNILWTAFDWQAVTGLHPFLAGLLISIIGMIVGNLFGKPPTPEMEEVFKEAQGTLESKKGRAIPLSSLLTVE